MPDSAARTRRLLDSIRRRDPTAQAEALHGFRPWLHLLARMETARILDGKFDASDVVQQTMVEAIRALPQFRGESDAELLAWLRQVLAHVLGHEIRRYKGTRRRDIGRELSLDQSLEQSATRLGNLLVAPESSPSAKAARNEREVMVAEVLSRLPEDYRDVIILHNLQGLEHEEVARRMGRSPGAVRMLWIRALTRLREEMQGLGLDPSNTKTA